MPAVSWQMEDQYTQMLTMENMLLAVDLHSEDFESCSVAVEYFLHMVDIDDPDDSCSVSLGLSGDEVCAPAQIVPIWSVVAHKKE